MGLETLSTVEIRERYHKLGKELPNMFWHILGIKVLEAKLSFFFSLSLQNLEHCVWISIL